MAGSSGGQDGEIDLEVLYSQPARISTQEGQEWSSSSKGLAQLRKCTRTGRMWFQHKDEKTGELVSHAISHQAKFCELYPHGETAWTWSVAGASTGSMLPQTFALQFKTKELAEAFQERFQQFREHNRALPPEVAEEEEEVEEVVSKKEAPRMSREEVSVQVEVPTIIVSQQPREEVGVQVQAPTIAEEASRQPREAVAMQVQAPTIPVGKLEKEGSRQPREEVGMQVQAPTIAVGKQEEEMEQVQPIGDRSSQGPLLPADSAAQTGDTATTSASGLLLPPGRGASAATNRKPPARSASPLPRWPPVAEAKKAKEVSSVGRLASPCPAAPGAPPTQSVSVVVIPNRVHPRSQMEEARFQAVQPLVPKAGATRRPLSASPALQQQQQQHEGSAPANSPESGQTGRAKQKLQVRGDASWMKGRRPSE